jgi:GT2 family glycosyltransferase
MQKENIKNRSYMAVYIIIVTFNGKKWISSCFESIRKSTIYLKTIVIDNASTDGTPDIIKKIYPEFDLIISPKNLGFGQANNIGIRKAYYSGADYVFLLNQDAWIEPTTIEKLLYAHKKQSDFDLISPVHLNSKGDALDYWFSIYSSPDNCKNLFSDIVVGNDIDKIYDTSFVNAAGWLLTRNCISTIGGFSPTFFHYGEDNNYIDRMHYFGLKIGIYPKCFIFHDRADRAIITDFWDNINYKNVISLKLSNPNIKFLFFLELFIQVRHMLLLLVRLRISEFKRTLSRIRSLLQINLSNIKKNKEASKNVGLTFI